MIFQFLLCLLLVPLGSCHVSWLFPEARWPHFDYTNNRDNVLPCGVSPSKNVSKFQTFVVNKSYRLNWRMQFGHRGGLQINLLSAEGHLIKRIAPESGSASEFFDTEMSQQEEINVTFDHPCENCILQLTKQATELGPKFLYFTCADIQVISEKDTESHVQQCHSSGKWSNNKCECDSKHSGEYCSEIFDCNVDTDCGDGGVCQKRPNSEVRKVCYCAYGHFGRNCELESKAISNDECFNFNLPNPQKLNQFDAYGMFKRKCYKQKQLNENDSIYSRVVADKEVEIILDFKTLSYVAIGWRPVNINNTCRNFPEIGMDLAGFSQEAYNSKFHPMHCTDIVWVSVVNESKLQIQDGYSRDKSTPLADESFPEGKNNLLAAFGLETNNRTIVMFRRAISTNDPADHPLGPGQIHGIYAKGQDDNETEFIIKEALELPQNKNRTFVNRDEFFYHGGDYRAFAMFRFV